MIRFLTSFFNTSSTGSGVSRIPLLPSICGLAAGCRQRHFSILDSNNIPEAVRYESPFDGWSNLFILLDASSKHCLTSMFASSLMDNVFTTIGHPSSSALQVRSGKIKDDRCSGGNRLYPCLRWGDWRLCWKTLLISVIWIR